MSIFLPYSPTDVLDHLLDLYSLDFTSITPYESAMLTFIANIYFFAFWAIITYFALKIFNRIWERFL